MTLDEWLDYLERLHPSSIELGLDRVRQVADRMQLDFGKSRIIVVGGTNGKGSTITLLSNILKAVGRSTGCYLSPHISIYNERVSLDGILATDEELCASFAAVEAVRGDTTLTYFEFGTLCALHFFACKAPDYILLEVGLGGRLDAVNIVEAELCILTNVALDHMDWLGDTREKIGFEKAGIFRPGIPAIYAENDIPESVARVAREKDVPLYQLSRQFLWSEAEQGSWSFQGTSVDQQRVNYFHLPATRIHLDNAAAVLQALLLLEPGIPENVIREALGKHSLAGRFEVISERPLTVVDVAHNTHAVDNLISQLERYYPDRKLHVVIAMLADKDSRQAVKKLSSLDASWYVGQLAGERGAPSKILYNHLLDLGAARLAAFESVEEAYGAAREAAQENDLVLVTGSFLTVAAVKQLPEEA